MTHILFQRITTWLNHLLKLLMGPFPDYQDWRPMGFNFIQLMVRAMNQQWCALSAHCDDLTPVSIYAESSIRIVYQRPANPELIHSFVENLNARRWQSREFDALSYPSCHRVIDNPAGVMR